MPFAAITNTIPALFWLFVHVFSDRNITALVRAEIEAVASVSKERPADSEEVQDRVVLEAARLEKECPTLHACYRESLRLYSDQLGNRRVVADTTVRASDVAGGSGREYLLRCGGHVQWPTAVVHRMESIWGSDAREFHFERFLNDGSNGNSTGNGTTNGNGKVSGKRGQHHGMDEGYRKLNGAHAESEEADRTRKRREALIPFGGGRNLCPGRNFAACEMLSLVAAIAVGFDIDGVYVPPATSPNWGAAIQRPDFDNTAPPHVSIRRRMSWDRVVFELKC